MTDPKQERYIGDGVYASFDGGCIWLRTGEPGYDQRIALEPFVYAALAQYVADLKAALASEQPS